MRGAILRLSSRLGTMPATFVLCAACVAVTLAGMLGGLDLAAYPGCGALNYLTSVFMHGGAIHLLMNVAVLAWSGGIVESSRGWPRMLSVFITGGLAGSVLAVSGGTAVVGASGGVWALIVYTAFMYLSAYGADSPEFRETLQLIAVNAMVSLMPGVSFLGHLGGAVVGAAFGLLTETGRRGRIDQ